MYCFTRKTKCFTRYRRQSGENTPFMRKTISFTRKTICFTRKTFVLRVKQNDYILMYCFC